MDIKDILDGQGSSKKVTSRGVDDTLWFSGRSRSLRMWRHNVSDKAKWRKVI